MFSRGVLPEENGENYQYLYQVKEYARKAGLDYYAKVAWKKAILSRIREESQKTQKTFVFTKEKLAIFALMLKKNKANPETEHYMSGAAVSFLPLLM